MRIVVGLQIVGSQGATHAGPHIRRLTFGRGSLGISPGRTVTVEAPMGQLHFEILEIETDGVPADSREQENGRFLRFAEEKRMDITPHAGESFIII